MAKMTYGNASRYNDVQEILPSAAYITDQAVLVNNLCQAGIHVVLDVTVKTSTPTSITLHIKGVCPVSGKKYVLLSSAAISTTGTRTYTVFPGSAAAANVSANDFIPKSIEISVVGVGVDSTHFFTFSVGALFLR